MRKFLTLNVFWVKWAMVEYRPVLKLATPIYVFRARMIVGAERKDIHEDISLQR